MLTFTINCRCFWSNPFKEKINLACWWDLVPTRSSQSLLLLSSIEKNTNDQKNSKNRLYPMVPCCRSNTHLQT